MALLCLPQVASCWLGVSSLREDDVVNCGTDQILLVFGSQSPPVDPVDLFLITDLCGTTYSVRHYYLFFFTSFITPNLYP